MEITANSTSSSSLHPVIWIAGISVTLLSIAGIASLTGLLPVRSTQEPPAQAAAAEPAPVLTPPPASIVTPQTPAVPAVSEEPAVPAYKKPTVSHHKTATKKVGREVPPANPAMLPPPLDSGVPPDYVPPPVVASTPPPCRDCGVIANVREVTREGQGSGAGAILGGVVGGALANNIGKGNGRTLATIAGAVGGGLLGNTIEKSQRRTVSYQVTVRMADGTTRLIDFAAMPPWRIGEPVKLVNGAIVSR